MRLYFNRTHNNFFNKPMPKEEFYDAFFEEYNINFDDCNYIHLHDQDSKEQYLSTTLFFTNERIIVFNARLVGVEYSPYTGYEVEIYSQKDIKSIKVSCDCQYNPTYSIKIILEKEIIEFTAMEQHCQNGDCKQAVKFLSGLLK